MSNILLQYMANRFNQPDLHEAGKTESLPFITISREYGCPAKEVAASLEKKLNAIPGQKRKVKKWSVLADEIIHQAAHELNVDISRIEKVFYEEKRTAIDEILDSLSEKYHVSDLNIIHKVIDIVKDHSQKDNMIIIGRNGAGLTHSLNNGLHIRLIAPIEWRIKRLMENCQYKSVEEAKAHAEEIDYRRSIFLKHKNLKDPIFDIYYNTRKFTPEQIADSIIYHLTLKAGK
jgi:cytidylate kinase